MARSVKGTKSLDLEFKHLDGIAALTPADLGAAKAAKSPPVCLRLNVEAMCQLRGVRPDKVPDPGASQAAGKMVEDFWGPGKRWKIDTQTYFACSEKFDLSFWSRI